jgi:hypothetical protein
LIGGRGGSGFGTGFQESELGSEVYLGEVLGRHAALDAVDAVIVFTAAVVKLRSLVFRYPIHRHRRQSVEWDDLVEVVL